MIRGGIATVFISDMDRAVQFYTQVLGLKLDLRFGNQWSSIKAPNRLVIGLHPASSENRAGRNGSMNIGFDLDEPIDQVVERLKKKGVSFRGSPISRIRTATSFTSMNRAPNIASTRRARTRRKSCRRRRRAVSRVTGSPRTLKRREIVARGDA